VAKRSDLPPLSEAQLEIMNVIWHRGEATVGEVWDDLKQQRGIARNTVQTTIARLDDKGWLKHRTVGNKFLYRAVSPRGATQKKIVGRMLDTVFEGSAEGLLLALLEQRPLSEQEAARIRDLLDSASGEQS